MTYCHRKFSYPLPCSSFTRSLLYKLSFFFFQAEVGIRVHCVTGVQTCALPISVSFKDWSEIELQFDMYVSKLKEEIKRKLLSF